MSYDSKKKNRLPLTVSLNPFGTGQCLTTSKRLTKEGDMVVSIPLEQGNVLRHEEYVKGVLYGCVSIPLEQGNVLRPAIFYAENEQESLNPFGTGQCLTTQNFS